MQTLCMQLGSFATVILNFGPAVEKTLSLWIQSLMHLAVIQCFTCNNDVANIRSKLLSCDLRLDQYSFDRFCHPFAVYIKLPILWRIPIKKQSVQQSKWSYVGSTAVGVTAREHNRRAKLKQVLKGQFVQLEPAVHFWAAKGNYSKFTIIVLHTFSDYRSAWIREHALIGLWQPRLNHPFVHRFLVKRAAGHKVVKRRNISGRPPPNFRRLFLRLRRRSTTVQQHSNSLIDKERAFAVLFDLAQDDIKSFEACKLIRSKKLIDSEVYTLWRIARTLEQPMKSKLLRAVCSALKFRNCSVPPGQTSLGLPFLAHHSFSTNVQVGLRQTQYKHWLIPLHLPSSRIVQLAQPSTQKLAYNFKQLGQQNDQYRPPGHCRTIVLNYYNVIVILA